MKLVSFLLYNLRIYITCSAGVVGGQGLWRGAKRGQGPPYFDPKGRSGPLFGLSSDEPLHVSLSFIFLSCLLRSSGCEISFYRFHAYLSAKIGDGRHISSEARTRPLFADRATGS